MQTVVIMLELHTHLDLGADTRVTLCHAAKQETANHFLTDQQ